MVRCHALRRAIHAAPAAAVCALAIVAGCSSSGTATSASIDGGGTSGGGGGASSGATGGAGAASSGAGGASTGSSSGTTSGTSSGTGASGSSGSSPGSSSGKEAGAGSSGGSGGSPSGVDAGDGGPDESAWLDPMNAARKAVGEQPLRWDPIAAEVAQAWANQCMWMHNPSASAQYDANGGTGGLGENIAAGAPTQTIAGAVASWVGEQADYDHATNTCATGKVCGHYTQVVWSTTTGVGCAQALCTTGNPFKGYKTWTMSVCDFTPPGNIGGQPPY